MSLQKALDHAAIHCGRKIKINWIDSEGLETKGEVYDASFEKIKNSHGVIVPGGFGIRGAEGKMEVIKYC